MDRCGQNKILMELKKTIIDGCFEIKNNILTDNRGYFVKNYTKDFFIQNNLDDNFLEEYYSYSTNNVLRGMHLQLPPHDHVKIVNCIFGEVLDVVIDLRIDSPSFGKYQDIILSEAKANMVYIPKGCAHGFCVVSNNAILMYKVSSYHHPSHDSGVRWDSIGIQWPIGNPIVSQRDSALPSFHQFIELNKL